LSAGAAKTINEGAKLSVTTTLTDAAHSTPITGATVTLLGRAGSTGAFATVATVVTNSSGLATASVKPTVNGQYEWQFAGSSGHASATSAAQAVNVAQVVTATVAPASVKHGTAAKIYGTVSPNENGQVVVLQQLVNGKWKTLTVRATIKKQLLPNHKTAVGFVLTIKEATKGTFTFRVMRAATAHNASGVSTSLKLKVT
jgi:hypothetical protein